MAINPTSPNGPRHRADQAALESARNAEAKKNGSGSPPKAAEAKKAGRHDSVDVSSEAKALVEQSGARSAKSSLSPDRLKQIGQRLASGFYDQSEVVDKVASRIAKDPEFKAGS